jgi:ferredoxin
MALQPVPTAAGLGRSRCTAGLSARLRLRLCIDIAPDLFELSDDLIAVARVEATDAAAAVEAASACPMGAIRLVEIRADATRRAA